MISAAPLLSKKTIQTDEMKAAGRLDTAFSGEKNMATIATIQRTISDMRFTVQTSQAFASLSEKRSKKGREEI